MLAFIYFFFAASDGIEAPVLEGPTSKLFGYSMRELLLLGGMIFVLAAALFLFAYLTRKKQAVIGPANSRAIYRSEPDDDEPESERRRYRKKRRRRHHPELLPRNPTLQETGGLPPLRPEEGPAEPTQ